MEKRAVNDMFVIISDIWLDNEEVIYILVQLFVMCFLSGFLFLLGVCLEHFVISMLSCV